MRKDVSEVYFLYRFSFAGILTNLNVHKTNIHLEVHVLEKNIIFSRNLTNLRVLTSIPSNIFLGFIYQRKTYFVDICEYCEEEMLKISFSCLFLIYFFQQGKI